MPVVHTDYLPGSRHYFASWCSYAFFCHFLLTAAVVLLPIVAGIYSGGFWYQHKTVFEQPDVRFRQELLLVLHGSAPEDVLAWGTFPRFNQLFPGQVTPTTVRAISTDPNSDGLADTIEINVRVPPSGGFAVHGVELALFFDYSFYEVVQLNMSSAVFLESSYPVQGSRLQVYGDLRWAQTGPLLCGGTQTTYETPLLSNENISVFEDVQFDSLVNQYRSRNETTNLEHVLQRWQPGSAGADFVIDVKLRIPPAEGIMCRPGFLETLKFAWIQYVALVILLTYCLSPIRGFLFGQQVFETRLRTPQKSAAAVEKF
jgi:transmembrane protein 231